MKKLYSALIFLVLLTFILTVLLISFMPDSVPMHYGIDGEVDRFGSKYENLIFPAVSLLLGALFFFSARSCGKKGDGKNEKTMLVTGVILLAAELVLFAYYMIRAAFYDGGSIDSARITAIFLGALLILLGNRMPKATRNGLFGLRTRYSMANDRVWQKSQRFGGISSVVCGLLFLLLSVFFTKTLLWCILTAIMLLWIVLCIVMSYKYYKADSEQ